jgi:predicted ATP-binding protein involved in virulence
MNKEDLHDSASNEVLEERIKELFHQLNEQKEKSNRLEERLRDLEMVRGAQQDLKERIQRTSRMLQELKEQTENERKTKWYDLKQIGLVVVGAILSYVFSKLN